MRIDKIVNIRNYKESTFDSVTQFIQMRRSYWNDESTRQFRLFENYLETMKQAEKSLEQLYHLPDRQLEGAHLIFGSVRGMREALANSTLRQQIRYGLVNFQVTINAETRNVIIQAETNNDGIWTTFKTYKISHNFYGIGSIRDPIALPN